jgi:hypothetical protein
MCGEIEKIDNEREKCKIASNQMTYWKQRIFEAFVKCF